MSSNCNRRMNWAVKRLLVPGACFIFNNIAWAGTIQSEEAWTMNAFTMLATLNGVGGITLLPSQNAFSGASTAAYAVAVTAGYAGNGGVPQKGGQSASALSSAASDISRNVGTGGFDASVPVASLSVDQATIATAENQIPLFSRGIAYGSAQISGVQLENSGANQSIVLSVNFSRLGWGTLPSSSLAYVSNSIEVLQQSTKDKAQSLFGFNALSMDGRQSVVVVQPPGNASVSNWLVGNTVWQENQVTLSTHPKTLQLSVPLISGLDAISIRNTSIGMSYEAPPRAATRYGPETGYIPPAAGGQDQIHWNGAGRLTFDRLPLDILSGGRAGDPLFNGFLEIDPLTFLNSINGLDYFSGGEIRLLSQAGEVLFTAQVPAFVFEDRLMSLQGFDVFAPILDFSAVQPDLSTWLKDYVNGFTPDSTLLPELFIGFSIPDPGSDIWARPFNEPVTAILSFAGTVPEPPTYGLFAVGMTLIAAISGIKPGGRRK